MFLTSLLSKHDVTVPEVVDEVVEDVHHGWGYVVEGDGCVRTAGCSIHLKTVPKAVRQCGMHGYR